jgi:AcrR family transcriptional regulator
MEENLDRRVRRTRRLLREALIELILEKDYEDITVEDITDRGDLGRTTFYLHFQDKRELLTYSLDVLLDDVFHQIYTPENLEKWEKEGVDPRKLLFMHVADNADLYRILLDGQVGGIASGHFRAQLAGILKEITVALQEKFDMTPRMPNEVIVNFVSGGLTGLLAWWLENDLPHSPEEMWEMYHQLMVYGVGKEVGFEQLPLEGESSTS